MIYSDCEASIEIGNRRASKGSTAACNAFHLVSLMKRALSFP